MADVTSDAGAGKAAVGVTSAVDDGLVAELVARAQAGGVKLTGLVPQVIGEPGERAEGGRDNYRNGHRSKTVITESGPVEIAVCRGTGQGRSSRSWSRSVSGVWAGWTRWSCRCRRRD